MPQTSDNQGSSEKHMKPGYFAPGIPSQKVKREIPRVREPADWFYAEQKHKARRAGLHSDLRLSDGQTAFSWAIRKGLPPPGESRLAIRQPDHDVGYMTYQGAIKERYGMGDVRLARFGRIRVGRASPDKINFTALDFKNPQEFTMVRTPRYGSDKWLLLNTTPTPTTRPDVPQEKFRMKENPVNDLAHYMGQRYALSSKIDGGQVIVNFGPKKVEAFSHTPSATGELINHSYILGLDQVRPKGLEGTQLRAEVFGVKGNKVLPMRILGGLLNSSPERALNDMRNGKMKIFIAPFQVVKHKGQPMEDAPYKDQLKIMEDIVRRMPDNWKMPDVAVTEKQKQKMIDSIKAKTHPLTEEGVVAWPLNEVAARPTKIKFKNHDQVYVREIFPMMSGGKPTALAGGFYYSKTPKGPILGKVGTGFDLKLRKELWDERDVMKGRKAVIESQGQFPSGAYRAPSFISFHL